MNYTEIAIFDGVPTPTSKMRTIPIHMTCTYMLETHILSSISP